MEVVIDVDQSSGAEDGFASSIVLSEADGGNIAQEGIVGVNDSNLGV